MESSTSEQASNRVAAMLSESKLVAFDHTAAGHDGISSNASGSLIIKPCTQAEIDFYESARDHPLFQAHMPAYLGSLTRHDDQEAVAPLLESSQDGVAAPSLADAVAAQGAATQGTPGLNRRVSWKPSGGKKISTGLAIVLENVASGFKHPNVLDVKLGARLWDDDAPLAKRRKLDEVAAKTTSGLLGIRVAGMKLWAGAGTEPSAEVEVTPAERQYVEVKNGYKSYNKFYGQSLSVDNVADAFKTYLGGVREDDSADDTTTRTRVRFKHPRAEFLIRRFLRELKSVRFLLEDEESRMYSASVLMVYEGDPETLEASIAKEEESVREAEHGTVDPSGDEDGDWDEEDEDEEEDEEDVQPYKIHELRLIDFAHARWTPDEGPDENALIGIQSLQGILERLVEYE
ncbi:uncharacterized protein PV07_01197 [Cladophialophora immunda]|uniref:Kinase n=1 Tax=Cladophialophora immunda TaxID=569365 RepID=A0A0D2DFE3_9EURO|nr:uncharacterized protein PV07_01197 [Cladophialophora immunda]KIW34419.1 hypothetical protein PV07_01197 [Cladophialophora immunda]OQV06927.1 hypothetical protein CLAIMM_11432 [Cladophialophora immunda]